jgi:photosystem II stability/assembly factor-like uncharacterized protein
MKTDFIDFPTARELQRSIGSSREAHRHDLCSAVKSNGALLCDCGAIGIKWREEGGENWERYVPNGEDDE